MTELNRKLELSRLSYAPNRNGRARTYDRQLENLLRNKRQFYNFMAKLVLKLKVWRLTAEISIGSVLYYTIIKFKF
jgi:hypothetical protein